MRRVIVQGGRLVDAVDLTAEELTKREALAEAERQAQLAEAAELDTIKQARPAAEIIQKLKDGINLTAAELQIVVRFLALRALRRG